MTNPYCPIIPDNYYHLYNRAVGGEKLFRSDENFRYFLRRINRYILPVAEIWTYSLLPNHFHLLIRARDQQTLEEYYTLKKRKAFDPVQQTIPDFIMEQFSNCFNGYTKAYNKMYGRKGALFMDYLRRSEAEDNTDIDSFIFYIHKNAVHHNLAVKIGDWKYDGYRSIISGDTTYLDTTEIINWFGSVERLKAFHDKPVKLKSKSNEFE